MLIMRCGDKDSLQVGGVKRDETPRIYWRGLGRGR